MHPLARLLVAASLLLLPSSVLHAQTAVNPSGHWEGTLLAPGMEIGFEVDLATNGRGDLGGTLSVPQQKLKGLPLQKAAVDGASIHFQAREDQPFTGVFSPDGTSLSGDLLVSGTTVPFTLTRAGEPRIEAPARSAPISRDLEGTWNGTLDVQGVQRRLVLTMSNQADGTATGRLVNLDEGGLQIPVAITQKASSVTIDTTVIASSFSGTLNAAGTELAGTLTQGALSLPLTFTRGAR